MTSLYDDLTAISRRAFAVAEADPFMRPPLGHRHKPYHWVRNIFADMEGKPVVWMWDCDGGVWVADGQHLLPKTENVLYMGPAEYGVGGETFEPTDADIRNMAIFLQAAYLDESYSQSADSFDQDIGDKRQGDWLRAAQLVFLHPSYTPSVIEARRKAVAEARNMIDGLKAEMKDGLSPQWRGVGGEAFEPTEADITDMAIFLAAAFHDISFSHASEAGFERDTRMRRVAGMVFKHHRYIPSIMAARAEARPLFEGVKDPDLSRDKVITEAKDMIAGLQAEAAGLRTVIARMSENRKLVQCRCGAVLGAADHPPIPGRALRFS